MLSKFNTFKNIFKEMKLKQPSRYMSIFITKSHLTSNKPLRIAPFVRTKEFVLDKENWELNMMNRFTQIIDNIYHANVDSIKIEDEIKKFLVITTSHSIQILSKDIIKKLIYVTRRIRYYNEGRIMIRNDKNLFDFRRYISFNIYSNFSRYSNNLLIKTNLFLKDNDLLLDTLFFIPAISVSNPFNPYGYEMFVYIQSLINRQYNDIHPRLLLFLLNQVGREKVNSINIKPIVNCLEKYDAYKDSILDLSEIIHLYYSMLNNFFKFKTNDRSKSKLKNITIKMEKLYCAELEIKIENWWREPGDENVLFFELVLRRVYELIKDQQNNLKQDNSFFIYECMHLFRYMVRFYIADLKFLSYFEEIINKYHASLTIIEKIELIHLYAKYTSKCPTFLMNFERDIQNNLLRIEKSLEFSQKLEFSLKNSPNSLDKRIYEHYKSTIFPNSIHTDLIQGNTFFMDIAPSTKDIIDLLWAITKNNKNESLELGESLSRILNSFVHCLDVEIIVNVLKSACLISLMDTSQSSKYHDDLLFKAGVVASKLKNSEHLEKFLKNQHLASVLYQLLYYLQIKYKIYLKSLDPSTIEQLQRVCFQSLSEVKISTIEDKLYNLIMKYMVDRKKLNEIHKNKIIEIYNVNLFIEPNVIIEYNLENNQNSNDDENYLIKLETLKICGYHVIYVDYNEFQEVQDDAQKSLNLIDKLIGKIV